jgi:hypothetical protein
MSTANWNFLCTSFIPLTKICSDSFAWYILLLNVGLFPCHLIFNKPSMDFEINQIDDLVLLLAAEVNSLAQATRPWNHHPGGYFFTWVRQVFL